VRGNSISGALWKVAVSLPVGDLDRYRVLKAPTVSERFNVLDSLVREQLELLNLMSQQGDNPTG